MRNFVCDILGPDACEFLGVHLFLVSAHCGGLQLHDSRGSDESSSASVSTIRLLSGARGLSCLREITWGVAMPSLQAIPAVRHKWRWTHFICRVSSINNWIFYFLFTTMKFLHHAHGMWVEQVHLLHHTSEHPRKELQGNFPNVRCGRRRVPFER